MKTVVGILKSRSEADRAVERLAAIGIPKDYINILSLGASLHGFVPHFVTQMESRVKRSFGRTELVFVVPFSTFRFPLLKAGLRSALRGALSIRLFQHSHGLSES
jgi:hypothetical protein